MPSHRKERIQSLLLQEIARILREEVKDPRVGIWVTVTRVKVTDDLRNAVAFWTVMGGDAGRRDEAQEGLRRSLGFIRGRVGQAVRMRFIPEVSFRYDQTFDAAVEVTRLIEQVAGERPGEDGVAGEDVEGDDAQ
ncbi:30S ribosome-binding factor RbfA [Myxococcota bacterium]|nr:30S ribosome-binding factor RbfA [Myxococcota bacterium]